MADVLPFKTKRAMTNPAALAHLRTAGGDDGVVRLRSFTALSDMMGWKRDRGQKAAKAWEKAGKVTLTKDPDTKEIILKVLPKRTALERGEGGDVPAPKRRRRVNKKSAAAVNKPDAQMVNKNAGRSEEAIPPKIEEVFPSKDAKSNTYGTRKKRRNALMEAVTESIRRNAPSAPGAPEDSVRLKPVEAASEAPTPALQPPQATTQTPPLVPDQDTTQPAGRDASADTGGRQREGDDMSILGFRKAAANKEEPPPPPAKEERQPDYESMKARRREEPETETQRNHQAIEPAVTQAHAILKNGVAPHATGFRRIARGYGWKTALLGVILAVLAFALSIWTAHLAVGGLQVLFPGLGIDIVIGGWIIEAIKFVGSTYIVASWRFKPFLWCAIGASLIFVAEVLNCGAIYNNLIAANLGETGARTTEFVTKDANQAASIEAARGRLADLDRRISQSDATIDSLTKRGRTRDANTEKAKRAKLSADRDKFQTELSSLQAGRTTIGAKHQEVEAAAMPIKHTATLLKDIGWMLPSTGSERVLMWLSVLIVACCDPLAISMAILTASWLPIPRMRRQ